MDRRHFLKGLLLTGLAGCGRDEEVHRLWYGFRAGEVILYDTYAMALYFDGGLGPKTGIVKVDYILKNQPVTLEFWHGHGGKSHFYTLTPDHFAELKKLKKIYVETTAVASHTHKLFIDPVDPKWRVPGAQPVPVPV
jgi:hypothetical protein